MARLPTVQAVKDYVDAYTKKLWAFRNWDSAYKYQAGDPTFYKGKWYYANPDNPPDKGQNPEDFIDRWNLIAGGAAGGNSQTICRRIKIARPGVKILNIAEDLGLSETLQYRVTPVLASNYPYFRHVFVERKGDNLWVYLYCDTEPYLAPRIGYLHGSTQGTNAKIGTKLVGTFYFGKPSIPPEEAPPPQLETELKIGDGLVVGKFIVGYIPATETKVVRVGETLIIGKFYVGEIVSDEIDVGETPDDELPGIFIDLFIQREV